MVQSADYSRYFVSRDRDVINILPSDKYVGVIMKHGAFNCTMYDKYIIDFTLTRKNIEKLDA